MVGETTQLPWNERMRVIQCSQPLSYRYLSNETQDQRPQSQCYSISSIKHLYFKKFRELKPKNSALTLFPLFFQLPPHVYRQKVLIPEKAVAQKMLIFIPYVTSLECQTRYSTPQGEKHERNDLVFQVFTFTSLPPQKLSQLPQTILNMYQPQLIIHFM